MCGRGNGDRYCNRAEQFLRLISSWIFERRGCDLESSFMALLFIFPPVFLWSSEYPSYPYYNPDILLGTVAIEFNMTYFLASRSDLLCIISQIIINCIRQRRTGVLAYTEWKWRSKGISAPTCNDCTLCYVHVWVGTFGEKHWAWSPCTFLRSLTYSLLSNSINIFWASRCDVTFSIPVLFQLRPFISCITRWLLLDENTYAPRLRNVYRKVYSKALHW